MSRSDFCNDDTPERTAERQLIQLKKIVKATPLRGEQLSHRWRHKKSDSTYHERLHLNPYSRPESLTQ